MADITNVQVVKWSNEHARRVADAWAALYNATLAATIVYNAQGLDALVPNTADFVADKSDEDGRGRITGAKLRAIKAQLDAFLADADASSGAKRNAIFAIAVNPRG